MQRMQTRVIEVRVEIHFQTFLYQRYLLTGSFSLVVVIT